MSPTQRQPKDRGQSEQRLLDAAKHVFAEVGFSAATTRDIAKRAGINLALIARYFKSKQGLLDAVLRQEMSAKNGLKLPYLPKKTFTEECLAFTESRFLRRTSDIAFWRIVMGQLVTDRKFVKKIQEQTKLRSDTTEFETRLVALLKSQGGGSRKELQKFATRIDTNIVSAVLFGIVINDNDHDEVLAELMDFVKSYSEMFVSFSKPRKDTGPTLTVTATGKNAQQAHRPRHDPVG